MTSPVPARFRGAWRRVSLVLGDGPATEVADVVWLQAERSYADLRVPRVGYGDIVAPLSFAGTTTFTDPYLRWSHDLDLDAGRGPADTDVGEVSWDGDDLVEHGEVVDGDRTVPYVEVWRKVAGGDAGLDARWSDDRLAVTVRVGDHALTIADERDRGGHYRACYRTRHEGAWAVQLAFGDGAAGLSEPQSTPTPASRPRQRRTTPQ